jgi:gliding motility-associated-like protein
MFTDESDEVPVTSVWDFGNGQTSTDIGTVENLYNTVGCYDVTLTNIYANGCSSSRPLYDAVCTYGTPVADFSWNPIIPDVDNSTVVFNDLSSNDVVSHTWDFTQVILPSKSDPITTPDIATSIDANPVVYFDSEGGDVIDICLEVANQYGCINTRCRPLTIINKFSVIVPNAFTPNGDFTNDTFFPKGRNLADGGKYEFRIYDRWGSLIWMTNDPNKGWDGTVTELSPTSGEIAQIDVYVWRLVVYDPNNGDKHELIGHVSLIR